MSNSTGHTPSYEVVATAAAEAPWITMVHGISQDRRVFARQVADFRSDYRLLLIDLPGHGGSAELPGPYGVQEFASAIAAALDAAAIGPTHFWGTHIGAGAGLLLACRAPDRFRSLLLEGPVFPGRPMPGLSDLLAVVLETARTQGMAAARALWWQAGWFDVMRAHPETCRAAEQRAIVDDFAGRPWLDGGLTTRAIDPIDDLLARLTVPVLIMNGQHDLPDFLMAAEALHGLLPDCRRMSIEQAGGFPFWEFPGQVNPLAKRFFAAA